MPAAIEKQLKNKEKVLIGLRETVRALLEDRIQTVILTEDADVHVKERIFPLCQQKGIAVQSYPAKKQLGEFLNIDVSAAVVSVLKSE